MSIGFPAIINKPREMFKGERVAFGRVLFPKSGIKLSPIAKFCKVFIFFCILRMLLRASLHIVRVA